VAGVEKFTKLGQRHKTSSLGRKVEVVRLRGSFFLREILFLPERFSVIGITPPVAEIVLILQSVL